MLHTPCDEADEDLAIQLIDNPLLWIGYMCTKPQCNFVSDCGGHARERILGSRQPHDMLDPM